jgi:hypothetical protein
VFTGPSPLELAAPADRRGAVLAREDAADHESSFVADPFMIRVGDTWHMFFESMEGTATRRGVIAHATSADGHRWTYHGVVLSEPFHLSYPQVFRVGSEVYMVPESSDAGRVQLYRADPFPERWTPVATLLSGPFLLDSTLFEHEGRWWMFTTTDIVRGTLRLFHAPALEGPWVEHPSSPVIDGDLRFSRSAGRVVSDRGRLFRFAQDCRETYGRAVEPVEITRLDPLGYEEVRPLDGPTLSGSGTGWNKDGMHHVDAHRLADGSWIACVDGWRWRLRRPREMLLWVRGHLRRMGFD